MILHIESIIIGDMTVAVYVTDYNDCVSLGNLCAFNVLCCECYCCSCRNNCLAVIYYAALDLNCYLTVSIILNSCSTEESCKLIYCDTTNYCINVEDLIGYRPSLNIIACAHNESA